MLFTLKNKEFILYYNYKIKIKCVKIVIILQLKYKICAAPEAPSFLTTECSAENNSVTVCWTPHPYSYTTGFLLELDDGSGGSFKVNLIYKSAVYFRKKETIL